MVREMARGQIIGEMSMYTEEPRSATVVAVRDSVLAKLARSEFAKLLATSAPMSIVLTRQIIKRLQTIHRRSDIARPITIGVLPITSGVQPLEFCQRLAEHLNSVDDKPSAWTHRCSQRCPGHEPLSHPARARARHGA